MNINNDMDYEIKNIFPIPLYITYRNSGTDLTEKKEIENIIEEGYSTTHTTLLFDTYIFKTKLKKLKEYCEQHIKIYAEQYISPKEKLDFYITQSWLNVIKPGQSHHNHVHPNSIISGVFYISTVEHDTIAFHKHKPIGEIFEIKSKEFNMYNSISWSHKVLTNNLILFPSWLHHSVYKNENATTDRISLSFNTFIKGTLGNEKDLTELVFNN